MTSFVYLRNPSKVMRLYYIFTAFTETTFMTPIIGGVSAAGIGRCIERRVAVHRGIIYRYLLFQRGTLGTRRSLGHPWKGRGLGQSLGCPSQAEPTSVYFPWWVGMNTITLERPSLVTGKGGSLGVEAQCKVPLRP